MEWSFYKGMQPGMQNLTRGLLGAAMGREQARNSELAALGDADLKAAQAQKARMDADLLGQKLARQANRGADFERAGAALSGVSVPEYRDYGQYRQTGTMPTLTGEDPNVIEGPHQPKYQWQPDQQARMDRVMALLALGSQKTDVDPKNLVDTLGALQGQDTTRGILDQIRSGQTQLASALNQGMKPGTQIKLYDQNATGAVLAPATGEVSTDNAIAQGTIAKDAANATLRGAQAQQANDMGRAALIRASREPVGPAPTPVTVQDPNDPTKAIVVDARSGRQIGAAPPSKKEKMLPTKAINDLVEAGGLAEGTQRSLNTFKDEYAGHTIVGDWSNTAGRILGDDSGQAQWWQDYAMQNNVKRNKLFGSALTATEKAEWEKTIVTPRMNPQQVRLNLTRQAALEAKAAQKLAAPYTAGGYSRDQIEGALGLPMSTLDTQSGGSSGFKVLGVEGK